MDHLAASFSSQKTVCSDAFDFLFDGDNLNPEKIEHMIEEHPENPGGSYLYMKDKKDKAAMSKCCVISWWMDLQFSSVLPVIFMLLK